MLNHPLARHLVMILTVKVVALALLYFAFFAPDHRPLADSHAVAAAILDAAPAKLPRPLP